MGMNKIVVELIEAHATGDEAAFRATVRKFLSRMDADDPEVIRIHQTYSSALTPEELNEDARMELNDLYEKFSERGKRNFDEAVEVLRGGFDDHGILAWLMIGDETPEQKVERDDLTVLAESHRDNHIHLLGWEAPVFRRGEG